MLRSIAFLSLGAALLGGQSFTGPVAAWYFQPEDRTVRAIGGSPGAAFWGAPMLDNVDAALAAPGCRQAIVRRGAEWSLYPNAASGPLLAAERIVWSANGDTALLAGNNQFQMLRAGKASPAQPLPPGRVEALAVSAKGTNAALIVDGILYRVSQQDELQTAQPLAATALAYAGEVLHALHAGEVLRLGEAGGAERVAEIPEAFGLSADSAGRLIVIAAHEVALVGRDGNLQRTPTDSLVKAWQSGCHADHLVLESPSGLSLFRSGEVPGVFFVPAAQEGN
jgi:hypothetical protein